MPNIKSAKKRVLVNAKKTEQNKAIRSAVKTEMKKVDLLIKENKLEEAKAALSCAFSVIDAACSKNIYHANNAANKKAKLAKRVNDAITASAVVVEEKPAVVEEVVAPVVEEVKPVAKKTTTRKSTAKKAEDGAEPAKKTTTRKSTAKKAEDGAEKPATTRKPRAKKTEAAE